MKKISFKSVLFQFSYLLLIIIIPITGCKNKSTQVTGTEQEGIVIEESDISKDEALKEITDYPLPTAFEVTKLLVDAGAGFIFDLCNRTDNVSKYINLKSKALNLGIYGADLSYSATYNQTQETMQYLEATSKLVDELQISAGFNKALVDRVDNNINNVDSLISIISDAFYKTYKYLNENEQDELSMLVLAGSWIEALYITSQINIISKNNEKIIQIISDQKSTINKLIEILEPSKDLDMISEVYKDLSGILAIYNKADYPFTKGQVSELTEKIETLRNKII